MNSRIAAPVALKIFNVKKGLFSGILYYKMLQQGGLYGGEAKAGD